MDTTHTYRGNRYATLAEAQAARRQHYLQLISDGMNSTQAAKTVGVSKRTAKVWRNGRVRKDGRVEKPYFTEKQLQKYNDLKG